MNYSIKFGNGIVNDDLNSLEIFRNANICLWSLRHIIATDVSLYDKSVCAVSLVRINDYVSITSQARLSHVIYIRTLKCNHSTWFFSLGEGDSYPITEK